MAQYVISKSLQADIDYIKRRADNVKKASYEIAWKLYSIVQSPDFADSGYKNIVDLAADHFGFARSTTLNYVAIANKYLTTEFSGGKDKVVSTTRARIGKDGKVTQDYAIGQLNALGKTTGDDFETMDQEGVINPDMSADKIKDAVKKWYSPDPDPEPDPDDTGDSTEQEEQKQIPCLTLPVFQILLNIVNPITDDFCVVTDPEPETAMDIFREFFHGSGYFLKWLTDPEDDEIIGAEMRDSSGNLLYTTNEEV